MTPDAVVFWAFVAAWVVLAVLLLVQLPRIAGEGRRLYAHLVALSDQSALSLQLAKAQTDAARLQAVLEAVPPLQRRAEAAVERIRTTPVVPPALTELAIRIRREWQSFIAQLN